MTAQEFLGGWHKVQNRRRRLVSRCSAAVNPGPSVPKDPAEGVTRAKAPAARVPKSGETPKKQQGSEEPTVTPIPSTTVQADESSADVDCISVGDGHEWVVIVERTFISVAPRTSFAKPRLAKSFSAPGDLESCWQAEPLAGNRANRTVQLAADALPQLKRFRTFSRGESQPAEAADASRLERSKSETLGATRAPSPKAASEQTAFEEVAGNDPCSNTQAEIPREEAELPQEFKECRQESNQESLQKIPTAPSHGTLTGSCSSLSRNRRRGKQPRWLVLAELAHELREESSSDERHQADEPAEDRGVHDLCAGQSGDEGELPASEVKREEPIAPASVESTSVPSTDGAEAVLADYSPPPSEGSPVTCGAEEEQIGNHTEDFVGAAPKTPSAGKLQRRARRRQRLREAAQRLRDNAAEEKEQSEPDVIELVDSDEVSTAVVLCTSACTGRASVSDRLVNALCCRRPPAEAAPRRRPGWAVKQGITAGVTAFGSTAEATRSVIAGLETQSGWVSHNLRSWSSGRMVGSDGASSPSASSISSGLVGSMLLQTRWPESDALEATRLVPQPRLPQQPAAPPANEVNGMLAGVSQFSCMADDEDGAQRKSVANSSRKPPSLLPAAPQHPACSGLILVGFGRGAGEFPLRDISSQMLGGDSGQLKVLGHTATVLQLSSSYRRLQQMSSKTPRVMVERTPGATKVCKSPAGAGRRSQLSFSNSE